MLADNRYSTAVANIAANTVGCRIVKPIRPPSLVSTRTIVNKMMAIALTNSHFDGLEPVSGRCVRMMKITRICVSNDSINQPVWKLEPDAWKISRSTAKVTKSKADDSRPNVTINFRRLRKFR